MNNRKEMDKLIGCVVVCLLMISCCHVSSESNAIVTGLDISLWKADSLGCDGYRKNNIANIVSQQKKIIGIEAHRLTSILGSPNIDRMTSYRAYIYYIKPNARCYDDSYRENSMTDLSLIVEFNINNQVRDLYLVVP